MTRLLAAGAEVGQVRRVVSRVLGGTTRDTNTVSHSLGLKLWSLFSSVILE